MMRRVPVLATVLVLAAVAVMVALGVWQLGRKQEKEALLARFAAAQAMSSELPWPAADEAALYRHARLTCVKVVARSSIAGQNADGESGIAQTAECILPDNSRAKIVIGWSRQPVAGQDWQGGEVRGVIAPGPRLVADPPLAGLERNALPDPSDIPNNHLAYAVQWFLFALTALVIYAIALWRRLRGAA